MVSTMASAGSERMVHGGNTISKEQISDSIGRLSGWLERNDYRSYDTFDCFRDESYLQVAFSACEHIVHDLNTSAAGNSICLSYIPIQNHQVHNSNTIGASMLAPTYSHTGNESYRALARTAIRCTANQQRTNGSW